MRSAKTSATDPIRVDFVPCEATGLPGLIGMTLAPGKKGPARFALWDRDLRDDLHRLRRVYKAGMLVSLVEDHELEQLRIDGLAERAEEEGLALVRFPIRDGSVPEELDPFVELVEKVIAALREGQNVVIHCAGGLGRTGVLAAACLVSLGRDPISAVRVVRDARGDGAVENAEQEAYLAALPERMKMREARSMPPQSS